MKRISSGSAFEDRLGYSRAVVSNGLVFVSATAATGDGGIVLKKGDFYGQTSAIFQKLGPILENAGSSLRRVVQTRVYVTDVTEWEAVGRAHAEIFSNERPAMSLIHVKPFLDADMLVEIEVVAALDD